MVHGLPILRQFFFTNITRQTITRNFPVKRMSVDAHGSFRRPSKWRIKQYCNYCHLFWNWKRFLNIHDVGFHEHQEYLETTIKSIRVYLTVTRLLVVYSSVQNYSIPLKLVFFAACSFIILLIKVNKYIMSTVY